MYSITFILIVYTCIILYSYIFIYFILINSYIARAFILVANNDKMQLRTIIGYKNYNLIESNLKTKQLYLIIDINYSLYIGVT